MNNINLHNLLAYKLKGEKFAVLTTYDASFAHLVSQAGVEVILVGDTLGNVIQGHTTTVPVSIEAMQYHIQCVARGNQGAFLIGDLPFMSYATVEQTLRNAALLMQAGAQMVKLEGGAWLAPTIEALAERGIAVCAHLGLTPQSVHKLGGNRVQGRDANRAQQIIADALLLEKAGASFLVLECVPSELASIITQKLTIPTIGIGAGPHCDAQVLVLYDMLGITPGRSFKHNKNFLADASNITTAIKNYVAAVKCGDFPTLEHSF